MLIRMPSKTTTVKIDEDGRCTIPVEVRESLGFNGEVVYPEITVHYND